MPSTSQAELNRILDARALSALFQPIVDFQDRCMLGYEALIRGPSDSSLHAPINLFEAANRYNRLADVELLAREISALQFAHLDLAGKLFLNVSPTSLLERNYPSNQTPLILEQAGISPRSVVIEISEQYPLDDYDLIRDTVRHYRAMGFEIAIDDLGAGYAGLRSWSELRPDYVKIDRHFIAGIDDDIVKQEFVRSIIDIAAGLGCRVIAEGIETPAEYQTVFNMGIRLGQGYYFGRPQAMPPDLLDESLLQCRNCGGNQRMPRLSETIESLAVRVPSVEAGTRVNQVAEMFQMVQGLQSLPVLRQQRPVGIMHRDTMLELFASRYGRELHGKKPIEQFMDSRPMIVPHDSPVETVSQKLTENPQLDMRHDFIISKQGQYLGMGHVRDLLRKITDLQIRNARHSNPLTQLPGNVPIYETIDRLLQEGSDFHIAYFDLDNFKPYNDTYGYSKGDQVIKRLAQILEAGLDTRSDFIGHVGGDDFVAILRSADWQARCQRILDAFADATLDFYEPADIARGGIEASDRQGQPTFFPLLSLSVGVASPDARRCASHHEVATLATDAKHMAKTMEGNALFVSRRQHVTLGNEPIDTPRAVGEA